MHESSPLILTHSQSTPSSDEDQQYSGRNVAIHDPMISFAAVFGVSRNAPPKGTGGALRDISKETNDPIVTQL